MYALFIYRILRVTFSKQKKQKKHNVQNIINIETWYK